MPVTIVRVLFDGKYEREREIERDRWCKASGVTLGGALWRVLAGL